MKSSLFRRCIKQSFNKGWVLFCGLLILYLYFLTNQYCPEFVNCTMQLIRNHTFALRIVRWLLILAMWVLWPNLVTMLGKWYHASSEKIQYWYEQRIKIILWLALFELLICENVVVKLIGFI